ncbi:hypothetical protein BDQ17DRAFT_1336981 [Cyathus striatus]|nr:hypothetical protein BDQ17DRAFT_1336981 [Cyathus striatus]
MSTLHFLLVISLYELRNANPPMQVQDSRKYRQGLGLVEVGDGVHVGVRVFEEEGAGVLGGDRVRGVVSQRAMSEKDETIPPLWCGRRWGSGWMIMMQVYDFGRSFPWNARKCTMLVTGKLPKSGLDDAVDSTWLEATTTAGTYHTIKDQTSTQSRGGLYSVGSK